MSDEGIRRVRKELFGVLDIPGRERAIWTRIGTAFENRDGSWNLIFDYVPTRPGITVNMRDPAQKEG